MAQLFFTIGAMIIGALGLIHAIYTLFTSRFDPRDPNLKIAMQNSRLILTRATSVWKAWIGFNLSHSLGALLLAAVYLPLSLGQIEVLRQSLWLAILPALVGAVYWVLAWRYWFKIPFIGISLASLCFILGFVFLRW